MSTLESKPKVTTTNANSKPCMTYWTPLNHCYSKACQNLMPKPMAKTWTAHMVETSRTEKEPWQQWTQTPGEAHGTSNKNQVNNSTEQSLTGELAAHWGCFHICSWPNSTLLHFSAVSVHFYTTLFATQLCSESVNELVKLTKMQATQIMWEHSHRSLAKLCLGMCKISIGSALPYNSKSFRDELPRLLKCKILIP